MKILQVIPRFNPNLGGGVHVVYGLSKYLSRNGHSVTILTTKVGLNIDSVKSIKKEGVDVIAFDYIFDWHLFIPSPKMKKWLKDNLKDFDIVHLNGSRSYQNNVLYKHCIKQKIPYVLQPHGSIKRIIEAKSLKYFYDIIWGYKIYKHASKVIALNQTEVQSCISMGIKKENIVQIPNGVDPEQFSKLPKKGLFRKKYGLNDHEKILLYVGRLHKSKKIDLLIHSFKEIADEVKDAKLVLVGPDGGYQASLNKMVKEFNIENRIKFTGLIDDEEKIQAFVDADVFVTPRFYGFPITFAEACACGLPIITTDMGESLNWININTGLLVKPNLEEFNKALIKILNDSTKYKTFKKNCIRLSRERFNWEKIEEKISVLYQEINQSTNLN